MTSKEKRLKQARKIRTRRGSEFAALKSGELNVRDVLENPEMFSIGGCDVWDVLRRARHLGRPGAKKILLGARVWPHDKVRDLSAAERADILKWLPARAR